MAATEGHVVPNAHDWEEVNDEHSHTTHVQLQIAQMTLGAAALGERQDTPWTSPQRMAMLTSQTTIPTWVT